MRSGGRCWLSSPSYGGEQGHPGATRQTCVVFKRSYQDTELVDEQLMRQLRRVGKHGGRPCRIQRSRRWRPVVLRGEKWGRSISSPVSASRCASGSKNQGEAQGPHNEGLRDRGVRNLGQGKARSGRTNAEPQGWRLVASAGRSDAPIHNHRALHGCGGDCAPRRGPWSRCTGLTKTLLHLCCCHQHYAACRRGTLLEVSC